MSNNKISGKLLRLARRLLAGIGSLDLSVEKLKAMNYAAILKHLTKRHGKEDWDDLVEEGIAKAGFGRLVLVFEENKVIKIAVDKWGARQNASEVAIWRKSGKNKLLVPILDYHKNLDWVIMPKVKTDKRLVEKLIGVSANTLAAVFDEDATEETKEKYRNKLKRANPELYSELMNLISKYLISEIDTGIIENWGVLDGRPVLLDYGIDKAYKTLLHKDRSKSKGFRLHW